MLGAVRQDVTKVLGCSVEGVQRRRLKMTNTGNIPFKANIHADL